jgi:hypothetical protein
VDRSPNASAVATDRAALAGHTAPADDTATIAQALAVHYAAHGLPADGGESSPWFHVRMGPLSIPLPNPPARQRAVIVHDVNHVLTGYDTVLTGGEMEIASFEIATGCGRVWVAWLLNWPLLLLGAIARPRRVFRAFVRGRQAQSLYHLGPSPSEVRAMRVGALRTRLGIKEPQVRATAQDRMAFVGFAMLPWMAVLALVVLAAQRHA